MQTVAPILFLLVLSIPVGGQIQPRCIASHQVVLAFGSGHEAERVETWLTADEGKSWSQVECERIGDGAVRYAADRDGCFGFYLVLENAAGRSADPPVAGTAPHITVIVDTAPPTLQVRDAVARPRAEGATINFRLTLIEENLGPGGLRLFYRPAPGEPWTDGGPLHVPARTEAAAETLASWPMPAVIAERVDLLLICTDRAGNVSRDEVAGVRTGQHAALAAVANQNREPASPASSSGEMTRVASSRAPVEPGSRGAGDLARAEQMRVLAGRFLAEGRFDLAAARFSDALVESPNDPQLLTEYGAALVRSNRLEDARQRFEAALSASPKNAAALEGLAMVAMGQQRLPDARDSLRRALEIDGRAGRVWLRYGDIEYRMGNQAAAFEAWKKAGSAGDVQLQASAQARLKSLQK